MPNASEQAWVTARILSTAPTRTHGFTTPYSQPTSTTWSIGLYGIYTQTLAPAILGPGSFSAPTPTSKSQNTP